MMILSAAELAHLHAAQTPIDRFGPETDMPVMFLRSNDIPNNETSRTIGHWLKTLPCPTVAIGAGALSPFCDTVVTDEKSPDVNRICTNIRTYPKTAMILVQLLRATQNLDISQALTAESFAYGAVQTGAEFQHWRANTSPPARAFVPHDRPPLKVEINDKTLALAFDRADNHNAIDVTMRDALCEALDMALISDQYDRITLTGSGKTFSTGGDVREFGTVKDPATAHWIRTLRLPATRLAHLSDRLYMHVNGAAVGAGAEIIGFAKHVTASRNAWFQLPELHYGLIPGAGGTAALPRRIGYQRTALLALSMRKINAKTARDWGLIDEIV